MEQTYVRIIDPGVEIIDDPNVPKKIEQIARVCYKSEGKITDTSYVGMLNNLIKNQHYAMLEHGSLVLEFSSEAYTQLLNLVQTLTEHYAYRSFLRYTHLHGRNIVSGNIRAWIEFFETYLRAMPEYCTMNTEIVYAVCFDSNGDHRWPPLFDHIYDQLSSAIWKNPTKFCKNGYVREIDLNELTQEELLIHMDVSVKFICDRGVSHEIVRHRPASFAQESTRYCNYRSKNGQKITVINPAALHFTKEQYVAWKESVENAGKAYMTLVNAGCSPQQARSILPNSVKTEIVMTTNLQEWKHFLALRACGTTGAPHPQMAEVAIPVLTEFQSRWPDIFGTMVPVSFNTIN